MKVATQEERTFGGTVLSFCPDVWHDQTMATIPDTELERNRFVIWIRRTRFAVTGNIRDQVARLRHRSAKWEWFTVVLVSAIAFIGSGEYARRVYPYIEDVPKGVAPATS
jgi:hypothetical protein